MTWAAEQIQHLNAGAREARSDKEHTIAALTAIVDALRVMSNHAEFIKSRARIVNLLDAAASEISDLEHGE